jgi:hypothetical protein
MPQNLEANTVMAEKKFKNPFQLYGGSIKFDVYREGKNVGSHVVEFRGDADDLTVISKFNLQISVLFINVFSFNYSSEANWKRGILEKLVVNVDDNGDQLIFNVRSESGKLIVVNKQNNYSVPIPLYPTNHWNAGVLNEQRILNTLTGELNKVKIVKKGMEKIETGLGKVNSIRYAYTGELETDIWYDVKGRWVGMQFMGRDGSLIKYICKKCSGPLAKEQKPNG